jgi:hypothetical protein
MPSIIFSCFAPWQSMPDDSLAKLETGHLRLAQPQRCWQASVGYDKFFWDKIETKAEVYYKWYDREYPLSSPDLQDFFVFDDAGKPGLRKQTGTRRAYGVELSLGNQRDSAFFYSLGSSLFDVKNRYADGLWHDDWTDVRYTVSLSLGARFLDDHMLSLSLQGAGGRPYCPETIVADCIARKSAVYESAASYFTERLDNLVAVNARYAFSKRIRGLAIESFIEILNLLNYRPALEYRFNGERFIAIKPFGLTPILGCTIQL